MKYFEFPVKEHSLKQICLFLGIVCIWIYTHPYKGIYHDARLYAVQALSHLYPGTYGSDLFFLYGSQDDYTIFSYIYAYLIDSLGFNNASILLLILGQALWFSAAFLLARTLLRGASFWLFLIFFCALSPYYATNIFRYGEPFLTPRIYAEALILYSVNLAIRDRLFSSMFLAIFAFLFHPLMAAGGFLFIFLYKSKFTKKYYLISIGTLTFISILAFQHIVPFSGILEKMDNEWYQIISHRNYSTIVGSWNSYYFSYILFNSCLMFSTALMTSGKERRAVLSALGIGLSALLVSWIGGDLFKNVFILQIQPYRALWIMHLFSYIAASILFVKMWDNSRLDRLLIIGYALSWFSLIYTPFGGILTILIFLIHFTTRNVSLHGLRIYRSLEVFIYAITFVLGALWLMVYWQAAYFQSMNDYHDKTFYNLTQNYLGSSGVILVFAFIVFRLLVSRCNTKPFLLKLLFLILLTNTVLLFKWDMRSKWEKYVESDHSQNLIPFGDKIPEGSVISWPNYFREDIPINAIWFLLKRSSYADVLQGSGLIFSKQTALEFDQRTERLERLDFFENKFWPKDFMEGMNIFPSLDSVGLNHVCQDTELDFIVHHLKIQDGLVDTYYNDFFKRKYYLYDCKTLRKNRSIEHAAPGPAPEAPQGAEDHQPTHSAGAILHFPAEVK